MTQEIELKLEVTPDAVKRLVTEPWMECAPGQPQPQVSVYFDTPDSELRRRGYTLRVRSAGDRFIQTVKSLDGAVGLFDRDEWESKIAGPEPEPGSLASTPLGDFDFGRLQPVVRSQINRRAWRLNHAGAEIEIDVDSGILTASGRQLPVHEIEIELLRGKAASAVALARKIAGEVPVKLGVMSKAERGFALADGALDRAIKSEPVRVRPDMSVAEGFEAIVMACVRHFRRNEALVVERRTGEALHQARVAMRRLRSALALFRPVVEDEEFDRIRAELRWFTGELGGARNFDVYLKRDLPEEVRAPLLQKRDDAYDKAIAAMESNRFRALMIDLVAWSALGEWRAGSRAARPLGPYANRRMDRWWSKIKKARRVAKMNDRRRHRLRIRIKKLRYALEFVAPLHSGGRRRRRRRFAKAIEGVQDSLGRLHDFVVARSIITPDLWPAASDTPRKEEREWVRRADRAVRRLRSVDPYWHRKRRRN